MLLAQIISCIHLLFILFIVIVPFTYNKYLLSVEVLIIPFVLLHWLTNSSQCALTELEKHLTGEKDDMQTVMGRIVAPIYLFKSENEEQLFLWTSMIILWIISMFKLHNSSFIPLLRTQILLLLSRLHM